jgi:hypothetical protein
LSAAWAGADGRETLIQSPGSTASKIPNIALLRLALYRWEPGDAVDRAPRVAIAPTTGGRSSTGVPGRIVRRGRTVVTLPSLLVI